MKESKMLHDRRSNDTLAAGQYAPIEVDDPYEHGEKIVVLRQLRCDPLARLHSHHQIDEAQFMGGRCYQRDWEKAERGARAIDPTKEAVDGGRLPEPITDSQAKARKRLLRVHAELGRSMRRIMDAVLIEGSSIEAFSISQGRCGARWSNYYGKMFRDGLDVLAVEYDLASRNKS
jgi:hypothetical protein